MYYHEAECHAENWFTICIVMVTVRDYIIKIWLFLLYLLNRWSVLQPDLLSFIVQHHKPECTLEKLDYCITAGQGRSKGSKCQLMFVQMIPSEPQIILLPNLVYLCSIMSQSVLWKNWLIVFIVKGTAWAYIYNQNMTVSTISYKLATKIGLLAQHHKLQCPVEKLITALKVKVTAKVQNVSECLSGWYLLNHTTFCYQDWYGDAASWARVSGGMFTIFLVKKWITAFKVKVTVKGLNVNVCPDDIF